MKSISFSFIFFALLFITSCTKDDPSDILISTYEVSLSSQFAVPGVPNRDEIGTVTLELFRDNSLKFTISVIGLNSTDNLTAAHIHIGDILSAGDVLVGLVDGQTIAFNGGEATGRIDLTNEQAARLMEANDLYVNVHSEQAPSGLVRGQIGVEIDQGYNVELSSTVANRTETGSAYVRVVNNIMYYKLDVNGLNSSDQIVASHIHEGGTGVDGGVLVGFAIESNADLGVVKQLELTSDQVISLEIDDLYINIHSAQEQPGLLRGQIRG